MSKKQSKKSPSIKKPTSKTPQLKKTTPKKRRRFIWLKKRSFTWKKSFLLLILTLPLIGVLVLSQTILKDLPSPTKLESDNFPVSTQIFDRHGTLLYEVYTDTHRTPIKLDSLPKHVSQASIAIEDKNFYTHFGFSIQGILRAFKNTVFEDRLQGGSTITQQLVKTTLLTPERTLNRKIKEAVLTLAVEIIYTKDEILEMYLNHIPYGGTAYGIEAASERFFGVHAKELSLAQAALLAGLPQAPTRYSPFVNPEQAANRQKDVLRRMLEDSYISQADYDQAVSAPLNYAPPSTDINAPHFVFFVKEILENKYGLRQVEQGGLRVTTSLDLALQDYAQASVSAEVAKLKNYQVSNGAALITKPDTGEILAMIGSTNYFNQANDGQVNLTNRLRQPGSSIKPLNYVTALQLKNLTPSSILLDIPTCFRVTGQKPYCPKNYDGSFHGAVRFRQALANSLNIPAVKILAINGLDSFVATASAMGISTYNDLSRYGLSLTLGAGEVTMLDMATAFGTLANQGVKVPLKPILKVTDYNGNVLEEYQSETALKNLDFFYSEDNPNSNLLGANHGDLTRILNREPAYLISHILSDNIARAMAFGTNSQLRIPGYAPSVKTGTTNDLKDNWTLGYTPHYLVATWVGNNDSTPMNSRVVSGVTGAAPIWHDLMSHLLNTYDKQELRSEIDNLDYIGPKDETTQLKLNEINDNSTRHIQQKPDGVIPISVCSSTGGAPVDGQACNAYTEYFWDQATPTASNITRKNIWVFRDTGQPAFSGNPEGNNPNPDSINPDNLELQEHVVISDPFTQEYCLDCTYVQNEQGRPSYPTTYVDMTTFRLHHSLEEANDPSKKDW